MTCCSCSTCECPCVAAKKKEVMQHIHNAAMRFKQEQDQKDMIISMLQDQIKELQAKVK